MRREWLAVSGKTAAVLSEGDQMSGSVKMESKLMQASKGQIACRISTAQQRQASSSVFSKSLQHLFSYNGSYEANCP